VHSYRGWVTLTYFAYCSHCRFPVTIRRQRGVTIHEHSTANSGYHVSERR
jgi:hypothetical protein